MTNKQKVEHYLEIEPKARERRNKDRALVNLLLKENYVVSDLISRNLITKERLIDFCHEFTNFDRCWRKVTEEREDLRGGDYDEKTVLEQRAQINLGYEPRYYQDIKA